MSTSTPKVSIIVPVHNAGEYLVTRIDSLINQTLQELEIILVLDCPTDGSDKIAETYAQKDKRIVLIYNSQNLHIGLSRNEGLKKATGEFISFMDHDDYCEPDMYEKLYQQGKNTNSDIVVSHYYGITDNKKVLFGFPENYSNAEFQKKSFIFLISGPCSYNQTSSITSNSNVWCQIFNHRFLKKHHITFQDNRAITFEDRLFLIETYYFAQKVTVVHEAFNYHLYHSKNSGSNYSYRSMDLIIRYLCYIHDFLKRQDILEKYYFYFADNVLRSLYAGFRNELCHKSILSTIKQVRIIRKNSLLQEALHYLFKIKNLHYLKKYPPTKLLFLMFSTSLLKNKQP